MKRIPRSLNARRFRRTERGSHLVELAIALPILLSLSLVSAEFGRLFFSATTLSNATRLGARYLTTANFATDAVRTTSYNAAKNLVVYGTTAPAGNATPVYPGLTTSNVVITTSGGVLSSIPDTVTVAITGVTFQPKVNLASLLKKPGLSLAVSLAPSTTMRYLITQPLNY